MSYQYHIPILIISIVTACKAVWYLPSTESLENFLPFDIGNCQQQCTTTADCNLDTYCFGATTHSQGCCLKALKPNETGCILEEQCKEACESTICDRSQTPSRCLCEKGHHFLFNKCWKKCPPFAFPEPVVDAKGFSSCKLRVDMDAALQYFRRAKRTLRKNFC